MVSLRDYVVEGSRITLSSLKHRAFPKEYYGVPEVICRQVVQDCWNGSYFQTSTGNFPQFWTRDFGWCVQSLVQLGYQKEVHKTLRYVLNHFQRYQKITTTITPGGRPFDFPMYSVDTLPWLIHAIKISHFTYYPFKDFLNKELQRFYSIVINEHTGLVKPDVAFSSMKDFAKRKSSCYDNTMVALLAQDLKWMMNLINLLERFDYPALIKRHFWNGCYFYDDLRKQDYVAGDANLFPFLFGLFHDQVMLKEAMKSVQEAGLDTPFPLKYTSAGKNVQFIWQEKLIPEYEYDTIWTHMGPLYIKLLKKVDPERAKTLKQAYSEMVAKHKNYLEVFFKDGRPYKSLFYVCDRGMLWAANYLTL